MATRGAIVRLTDDGFVGVRHQRYSMPEALGKQLWDLYQGHFNKDLAAMMTFLIDTHPGGWSSIVGADFTLPPNYQGDANQVGPQCYCHGRMSAGAYPITPKTIFEQNLAWTYAFDVENKLMWVIYNDLTTKQLDREQVVRVSLADDEPDWKLIRCGLNLERCEHLAAEHYPALANTPSGRMRGGVYAGSSPLTMQDAYAVMIGGVRYELTGKQKGGNGVFHAWGIAKGGRGEQDLTIGRESDKLPGGYMPAEGVVWVFAPTRDCAGDTLMNRETFVTMHGGEKARRAIVERAPAGEPMIAAAVRTVAAKGLLTPVIRLGTREIAVPIDAE